MSHLDLTEADCWRPRLTRRRAMTLLLAAAVCPLAAEATPSVSDPACGLPALACHAPSEVALYLPMLEAATCRGELWLGG